MSGGLSVAQPGAQTRGCETQRDREWEEWEGGGGVYANTLEVALRLYEPVENDPAELCLYTAQQLQLEEVLTQAIGAPVGGAHAAETGVAAKRHRHVGVQHPRGGNAHQDTHRCKKRRRRRKRRW